MILLAIDPSINNVGWARRILRGDPMSATSWGTIRSKGTRDQDKIQHILEQLKLMLDDTCTIAVIEDSKHMSYARSTGTGGKSLNAASLKKLHVAFGAILGLLMAQAVEVVTVLPEEYKPKQERRGRVHCMSPDEIRWLMGLKYNWGTVNEHEAHALYMLDWKYQQLLYERRLNEGH